MPLEVRVYPKETLVWVTGQGVVTEEELLEYVQEHLIDGGLRTYDEIFDLSASDLRDVTPAGLSAVATAAATTDPQETPTKIAILVSESVGVGISRMYQTLREDRGGRRNLRIFWDLPELLEWMGLSEQALQVES